MAVTFDTRAGAAGPVRAACAVLLPGTGSDADFALRALGGAAAALGVPARAATPGADLVAGYERALEAAAGAAGPRGRIVVAGVSIGAMVAAGWALRRPESVAGVIAAMPAWCGGPDGSAAAASAAVTADRVAADGIEATIARMRASSPGWLGDELARSWRVLGADLEPSMRAAARFHAPDAAELADLHAPLGIVGIVDDPLHPVRVARAWRAEAPRSALETTTLDALGADPAVLGRLGAAALLRAAT